MKKSLRNILDGDLQPLIDQRDELQKRIQKHSDYFYDRRAAALFWGIVGTASFLADATICGGICSVLVGVRAADMTSTYFKTHNAEKQLKELDAQIQQLVIQHVNLAPLPSPQNGDTELTIKKARDTFNRASQDTIEELQKRITQLQKQVDGIDAERAMQAKPRKIDKPRFKPPSDFKPPKL